MMEGIALRSAFSKLGPVVHRVIVWFKKNVWCSGNDDKYLPKEAFRGCWFWWVDIIRTSTLWDAKGIRLRPAKLCRGSYGIRSWSVEHILESGACSLMLILLWPDSKAQSSVTRITFVISSLCLFLHSYQSKRLYTPTLKDALPGNLYQSKTCLAALTSDSLRIF